MSTLILRDPVFLALNAPGGMIDRAVAKGAGSLRDNARRFAPVNTGRLRQSIESQRSPIISYAGVTYRVGTRIGDYAYYQHEGVAGPILPRRAKALRFIPKGGGGFIFAARTKGFPGTHYLTKAMALLRPGDFG